MSTATTRNGITAMTQGAGGTTAINPIANPPPDTITASIAGTDIPGIES